MAPVQEADSLAGYRCRDCGKLEIRQTPEEGGVCPECGSENLEEAPIVGGAIRYSVADRRSGPSIEDTRLGRMGYFAGWLDFAQIATCLQDQKEAADREEEAPKFGQAAVARGFLADSQVVALLRTQVIHNGPPTHEMSLGALAVGQGLISQPQLDECLLLQKSLLWRYEEAPLLGILLTEKKFLTSDEVKGLLETQAEQGVGPLAGLRADPSAEGSEGDAAGAAAVGEGEAPTAEELTRDRVLCRCAACGKSSAVPSWSAEDVCPHCESSEFMPVTIVGVGAAEESAGQDGGPSIEDGRLGRMAYFAGWMTSDQVRDCLRRQEEELERGQPRPRFGEVATEAGLLTEPQIAALLRMQGLHQPLEHDRTFGAVAVRQRFITQEQLDECLDEQRRLLREGRETPALGVMMSEKKMVSDARVKAILSLQARHGQGLLAHLEAARAAAAPRSLKGLLTAARGNRTWLAAVCAAVILFCATALATGWFGAVGWRPPGVVAGCRSCGAVVESVATGSRDCPECGMRQGLCPLVRCVNCGKVFLYGPYGSGVKCPVCGGEKLVAVTDVAKARKAWKPDYPAVDDAQAGKAKVK